MPSSTSPTRWLLTTTRHESSSPTRPGTSSKPNARAGVAHHVLLSILGVDRVHGNAHYVGKRHQEHLVQAGPVPYTIVRAAQFHDFAAMVVSWTRHGQTAVIPPLLVQPVAVSDVADVLATTATAPAAIRHHRPRRPRPTRSGGHGTAHTRPARRVPHPHPELARRSVRHRDGRGRPASRAWGAARRQPPSMHGSRVTRRPPQVDGSKAGAASPTSAATALCCRSCSSSQPSSRT